MLTSLFPPLCWLSDFFDFWVSDYLTFLIFGCLTISDFLIFGCLTISDFLIVGFLTYLASLIFGFLSSGFFRFEFLAFSSLIDWHQIGKNNEKRNNIS